MTCTYSLFISIVLLMSFTKISVATLLQLAGQNFFVLYLFAALGYTKLHAKQPQKWIGYLGIASVLAMMSLFSIPGLVYCVILAGIGCFMSRSKTNSNSAN
jgi:hypothetical protein